jgi:hypothetical protein
MGLEQSAKQFERGAFDRRGSEINEQRTWRAPGSHRNRDKASQVYNIEESGVRAKEDMDVSKRWLFRG